MNTKKLIGMAVVLVILAGIALMQKQGGRKARPEEKNNKTTLFAGVELNRIDGLEVAEGSNSVVLAKQDGKWRIQSLFNYPADFKKLAGAMRAAAEVELGRPVRASNIEASEYGFDEAKTVLLKAGGKEAVRLDVGAQREPSSSAGWANQRFIRKDGAEAIHLVDYDFRPFSANARDWIDKELLNVRSSDIISVMTGDVQMKVDGADWKLVGLDEENEELQSAEANKLRSALQYLNCTTIADPGKSDAELGFTNAVVYTASAKDGFVYTVAIGGEGDGGRYARFGVAYEKPDAPIAPADDAEQEKKDAYPKELEAFNKTCEANENKAKELTDKLSAWTYVISTYDAADFLIARDKLVKAKETEEEENPSE